MVKGLSHVSRKSTDESDSAVILPESILMLTSSREQHSKVHFKTYKAAYADNASHPFIYKQSHDK